MSIVVVIAYLAIAVGLLGILTVAALAEAALTSAGLRLTERGWTVLSLVLCGTVFVGGLIPWGSMS